MTDASERGTAVVMVMLFIVWLTALGSAMTIATMTETAIAANYREATETLYAAEAAVEFAMQELATMADWRDAISEAGRSTFTDGPPGVRAVGPFEFDLIEATQDVRARAAPGVAAPVLFAFGRFRDLVPFVPNQSIYVAVWIADRSEAEEAAAPDRLSVLGQAYGVRGSRRAVEATVVKTGERGIRVLAWREVL